MKRSFIIQPTFFILLLKNSANFACSGAAWSLVSWNFVFKNMMSSWTAILSAFAVRFTTVVTPNISSSSSWSSGSAGPSSVGWKRENQEPSINQSIKWSVGQKWCSLLIKSINQSIDRTLSNKGLMNKSINQSTLHSHHKIPITSATNWYGTMLLID